MLSDPPLSYGAQVLPVLSIYWWINDAVRPFAVVQEAQIKRASHTKLYNYNHNHNYIVTKILTQEDGSAHDYNNYCNIFFQSLSERFYGQ